MYSCASKVTQQFIKEFLNSAIKCRIVVLLLMGLFKVVIAKYNILTNGRNKICNIYHDNYNFVLTQTKLNNIQCI